MLLLLRDILREILKYQIQNISLIDRKDSTLNLKKYSVNRLLNLGDGNSSNRKVASLRWR